MPPRRPRKSPSAIGASPQVLIVAAETHASPRASTLPSDSRAKSLVGVDWFGVGLAWAWSVVAVSLAWYEPTLPTYPDPARSADATAIRWTDALARPLHEVLGWSAWLGLVGSLAVVWAWLGQWSWRAVGRLTLGWLVLTVSVATFACAWPTGLVQAPLVGEGGTVGAWLWLHASAAFGESMAVGLVGAMAWVGVLLVWPGLALGGTRALRRLTERVRTFAGRLATRAFAWVRRLLRRGATAPQLMPVDSSPSVSIDRTARCATDRARSSREDMSSDMLVSQSAKPAGKPLVRLDRDLPPLSLLEAASAEVQAEPELVLRERAERLQQSLADFGLQVQVVGIHTGPVVTLFEIALETGLRLSRVTGLAEDLAVCLRVPSVRIVAPLPGKNTVGVEVPNSRRQTVRLRELIEASGDFVRLARLPLFLGKDSEGRPLMQDLAEMPHLLIAGTTGTGKSVCLNAVILSLVLTRTPQQVRLIMIDPKMLELSEYGKLPHLLHPVVNKDMRRAEAILGWAVEQMEHRYELLSHARVRNLHSFNELGADERCRRLAPATEDERQKLAEPIPYIVIVIDEMGDLMMMMKKEVEGHIIRLAQKSRAAGIHLILATQKPTVDVITGLIKSNLPARICFKVASRTDSRVVLDEMGAEKLLGKGDMLYLQPAASTLVRAQGAFASDREIAAVVEYLQCDEPNYDPELLALKVSAGPGEGNTRGGSREGRESRDALYHQAVELVIREGRGSTSLLQRGLGIGYGRAARMIEWMAEDGIVGGYNGSQAREVLLTYDEWCQRLQPESD